MGNAIIENPIFKENSGLVSELKKTISMDDILSLEQLGYIENGISPQGETWKLTSKGKESRDFMMIERSRFDAVLDWMLDHVVRFRVSL